MVMDTYQCVCGKNIKIKNTQHPRTCGLFQKHVREIESFIKTEIPQFYEHCLSVSDSIQVVKKKTKYLQEGRLRNMIVTELKTLGIYRGLDDPDLNARRQSKLKATMRKRYGVSNNGQREGQGFGKLNKIPFEQLAFMENYKKFRKQVDADLKKKRLKIPRKLHCEYTGIEFTDNQGPVNPNDPRKHSFDHRQPVIECFLKGWTVEQTNSSGNLVQCLRLINTIKGNTTEESFLKILSYLKEKIDESIQN